MTKLSSQDLQAIAAQLKPGESIELDARDFDKSARELEAFWSPVDHLQMAFEQRPDGDAFVHSCNLVSRQLQMILEKAGVQCGGVSFARRIELAEQRLSPPLQADIV